MIKIIEKLKELSNSHGIIGIKQSFEDEGIKLDDLVFVRRVTDLAKLQTFVKIGGCEAKTDINNCLKIGVDSVIAPMIESKFALSKFTDCIYKKEISGYVLIESKTGYKNIDGILESTNGAIAGIIVGRSDLSKSYNLSCSDIDCDFIYDKVSNIFRKCKSFGILTAMGGGISTKSSSFIQRLYYNELLNRIETRNIVISLNDDNVKNIENLIAECLKFEISLLEYKRDNCLININNYNSRIQKMKGRFCD